MTTTIPISQDESDLTFKATFNLNTIAEEGALQEGTTNTCSRNRLHTSCMRSVWADHKTLLYRLAVFVFFTILITLLETIMPNKMGILTQMLNSWTSQNDTRQR